MPNLQSQTFSISQALEEPKSLVRGTIQAFGAIGEGGKNPDVETLQALVGGMVTIEKRRGEYIVDLQSKLRSLSKSLTNLQHQPQKQLPSLDSLESKKFEAARNVQMAENDMEKMERHVRVLTEQVGNIVNDDQDSSDNAVLKLQVYRGLGVELIEQNGKFNRVLVKSSSEVKSLTLQEPDRFQLINEIWKCLSE